MCEHGGVVARARSAISPRAGCKHEKIDGFTNMNKSILVIEELVSYDQRLIGLHSWDWVQEQEVYHS